MDTRHAELSFEQTWPRIARFLEVTSTGYVESDYLRWAWWVQDTLNSAELAASYEEWADFYEWQLARRADELAEDRIKRHLVEEWTDDMAYCCRRAAAFTRGKDPGTWVPLCERRPDLDATGRATGRAIVAEIIANLSAADDHVVTRELVGAGAGAAR